MRHQRSAWIRALRLYHALGDTDPYAPSFEARIHARSRFRSVRQPERFAVYSLHEPGEPRIERPAPGDHTLIVVREFRRVPLFASALGLVLFAARAGREAQVVATLAHWAERALSLYQPPYLLLARSMESPGITMVLAGVQAAHALEHAGSTAFSVDHVLPEVSPLLAGEPEWYAYSPEMDPESVIAAVSPNAV